MDQLLVPEQLAGRGPERHHRVGVAVVAQALAAIEVRARRAGRDEHEIALGVDREDRPGIGGAGARRLRRLPAAVPGVVLGARDRVPGPAARAGPGIERAHRAELELDRPVVADRRAGDHQIARDRGRRGDRVLAGLGRPDVLAEVDRAAAAEVGAGLPGHAVEGDQPAVERADEDPKRARGRPVGGGIAPGADAARGRLGIAAAAVDPGVVAPELAPARRVEGDHLVGRGREVEPALDQDRRRLEGELVPGREALAELAGPIGPGDLELADVAPVDLGQRRIARAARIAAVDAPAGHRLDLPCPACEPIASASAMARCRRIVASVGCDQCRQG